VYEIYISPKEYDEWGDDFLGDEDILSDGETFTARLEYPLSRIDTYDILLVDEDGNGYTKFEVTVSNNKRIEFTLDDLDEDLD
jgi:hypothetical protein